VAVTVTVVVGWLEEDWPGEDWPEDGWLGAWAPEQIPAHASRAAAKEKDKLPGKRIHFRLQDEPVCSETAVSGQEEPSRSGHPGRCLLPTLPHLPNVDCAPALTTDH
jgi:hypothetical protein